MTIRKRDLCGYYLWDYCLKLRRACESVKLEDCPATKELLELVKSK
jgi:hypothetical protein